MAQHINSIFSKSKRHFVQGALIVEILIAFALSSIMLPVLLSGFITSSSGRETYEQRLQALGLMREAEEAVRSVREASWSSIATNGTYYPVITGSSWSLSTNSSDGEINGFTRTVEISDLSPSDLSKKQVLITVSWPGIISHSVSSTIYLTRWGNTSSPGEIASGTLVQQGFGNWCKPSLATTNVDLVRQGHPTTVRAFESGNGTGNRVLAGTGANSSGPAFSNIVITGDNPPSAASVTDYNGTPQIKANGVFGTTSYAYLATDNKGVEILDLNTSPYQEIGSFNPNGMKPAQSVYVVGNTGYVVTTDKFYIFSISADRTTTVQIGVLSFSGGVKIFVDGSGQYAYVVTTDLTGQLKIIDVHTNPSSPTVYSQVALGGAAGRDIYVNANLDRAYLATATSVNQPEFFIIDISNKQSPVAVSGATYDTNGMDPQGVAIVSADRAVIVGTGGNEYQVFSVSGDTISFCPNHGDNDDFLNVDDGVFAVSSVLQTNGHAYSYIVTGDANGELKIIEGGPGGVGGGGGAFESAIFDAGSQVIFNYFNVVDIQPEGITVNFQIAVSPDCTTFNYVGSDGTAGGPMYGDNGGAIPTSINPGRCFRYKGVFTGGAQGENSATTTVSVNYSP